MPRVSALLVIAAVIADCLALTPVAQAVGAERSTSNELLAHQYTLVFQVAEAPLRPPITRPNRSSSGNRRPNASSNSNQEEFRYRLIVEGSSESLLRQVRRVVPDAFRALIDGRRVIQAGLFVEREEAEAVQQQLEQIDAATRILDVAQTVAWRSSSSASSSESSGSSSSNQTGYQYRLVVQGSSDSLLRQVRAVVPDAFRTTIAGRRVIQAGLFVDQEEATSIQRQLSRINAETNILDVGYGITQPSSTARLPQRDGRVVVVVDPGHGGRDPGAVGIGGIYESDIVLDISQQVASLLEEQGIQAILTREDDREVDLAPRVSLAESINANLFVSIHANAISLSRPDVNGIETYYYDTGAALAASIHNSLVNATGMNDRGVRQARFYVLTRTSMPAVLVEVGFVTGQDDAARLGNAAARSQIAAAIAQGILRYVQQRI